MISKTVPAAQSLICFEMPYNFKPVCQGGIMEKECSALLKDFFKKLR